MKKRYSEYLRIPGKRIKAFRTERRLTQKDFAKLSGIKIARLQKIERGEVNLRFTTLYTLAQVMKIPFHELISKS